MADVHDARSEAPPSPGGNHLPEPAEPPPDHSTQGEVDAPSPNARAATSRKGRCANHPGVAQVASCDVCGRPLCVACAVPVRGSIVGPECVGEVLPDILEPPVPARPRSWGRRATVVGFAIVLASTIRPWAGYGDASGSLEAWTLHWSLLAVTASLAGLIALFLFRRRRADPLVESGLVLALAAVALLGTALHGYHPPPLSTAVTTGWALGVAGAALAFVGACVTMVRALTPAE
jgi:hypothetical protein